MLMVLKEAKPFKSSIIFPNSDSWTNVKCYNHAKEKLYFNNGINFSM